MKHWFLNRLCSKLFSPIFFEFINCWPLLMKFCFLRSFNNLLSVVGLIVGLMIGVMVIGAVIVGMVMVIFLSRGLEVSSFLLLKLVPGGGSKINELMHSRIELAQYGEEQSFWEGCFTNRVGIKNYTCSCASLNNSIIFYPFTLLVKH